MSDTDKIVSAILAAMLLFVEKEEAKTPAQAVKKYRDCYDCIEDAQMAVEVEKVDA